MSSTPNSSTPHPPQTPTLYTTLSTYPFDTDPDFQHGLRAILLPQHSGTESAALILAAKCFYFARKTNTPPIDARQYELWLESQPPPPPHSFPNKNPNPNPPPATATATNNNNTPPQPEDPTSPSSSSLPPTNPPFPPQTPAAAPAAATPPPPPYPASFTHLVSLISNGDAIPGIRHVPDTLLGPGQGRVGDESVLVPVYPREKGTRRRKPWEKRGEKEGGEGRQVDGWG